MEAQDRFHTDVGELPRLGHRALETAVGRVARDPSVPLGVREVVRGQPVIGRRVPEDAVARLADVDGVAGVVLGVAGRRRHLQALCEIFQLMRGPEGSQEHLALVAVTAVGRVELQIEAVRGSVLGQRQPCLRCWALQCEPAVDEAQERVILRQRPALVAAILGPGPYRIVDLVGIGDGRRLRHWREVGQRRRVEQPVELRAGEVREGQQTEAGGRRLLPSSLGFVEGPFGCPRTDDRVGDVPSPVDRARAGWIRGGECTGGESQCHHDTNDGHTNDGAPAGGARLR